MSGEVGVTMIGQANVITTDHGGVTPEQVADLCLDRIISIGDTAPPVLRDQALEYREAIRQTLVHFMKMAASGQRTTIAAKLQAAGHADVANIIKEL